MSWRVGSGSCVAVSLVAPSLMGVMLGVRSGCYFSGWFYARGEMYSVSEIAILEM